MFEIQFLENSIPTPLTYFRNNEPIILNPTTILEEYNQYWRPTETTFSKKSKLYIFLKDPLLKRIRTKNHPNIRHVAETMSIKDRKSCILCCGSCIPDFPNQQNHKYLEGYRTVNRCRFCEVYLCNDSRRFLEDLSYTDYWYATEQHLSAR